MKWWCRVFWRLHDIAILNAFTIHKANKSTSLHRSLMQKQFRMQLAYALCEKVIASRTWHGWPPVQNLDRLRGKHFLYRGDERKQCVVCGYKKASPRGKTYRDTKVQTFCKKCKAHLCIGKCNEACHTKVNYKC